MAFYKGNDNRLYFLDSEAFEHLLPAGATRITDEEGHQIQAANNSQSETDRIKSEIALLEAQQTPRRLREASLGIDNGWLANLEAQISALRQTL